ncbi:GNAT family N-acetyltransferase [Caulobacter segnis]|uniref:GNAT family N-acetyltransferase n=1 Tax=Caulobacter segnis TaxID=88688 RepID=UPI00240F0341|nr:GNAT family N-acetyltransferase [Caulobacter segnis]MDG2521969.1 GNAT family N-acetyltransferase [Caulobacter segnis]
MSGYVIRRAVPADFPILQQIEISAGEPFRATQLAWVADDPPPSLDALQAHLDHGGLWVITLNDRPVGYLAGETHGELAVIHQVSVHLDHHRQGLGAQLIEAAVEGARKAGATTMGLTTYRDTPWNGPYYARLGFTEVTGSDVPPALQAMRDQEAAAGHDPALRSVMIRPL